MDRESMIQYLVANSAAWEMDDYDHLSGLSDQKLALLVNQEQAFVANANVAKLAVNGFQDGKRVYKFNPEKGGFVVNDIHTRTRGDSDDDEYGADDDAPEGGETQQGNVGGIPRGGQKKMTNNAAWWNSAPQEVKGLVANYQNWEMGQKEEIVSRLVANFDAGRQSDAYGWLMNKPLDELQALQTIVANSVQAVQATQQPAPRRPSFWGANAGQTTQPVTNANPEEDLLLPPTMNWDEPAANGKAR